MFQLLFLAWLALFAVNAAFAVHGVFVGDWQQVAIYGVCALLGASGAAVNRLSARKSREAKAPSEELS